MGLGTLALGYHGLLVSLGSLYERDTGPLGLEHDLRDGLHLGASLQSVLVDDVGRVLASAEDFEVDLDGQVVCGQLKCWMAEITGSMGGEEIVQRGLLRPSTYHLLPGVPVVFIGRLGNSLSQLGSHRRQVDHVTVEVACHYDVHLWMELLKGDILRAGMDLTRIDRREHSHLSSHYRWRF